MQPPADERGRRNLPPWTWNWNSENVGALREALAYTQLLPPDIDLPSYSLTELWSLWRDTLLRTAHQFCTQLRLTRSSAVSQKRPWMTPDLLNNIRTKHRLYRKYLRTRTAEDWDQFTTQRNKTTTLLRSAKSKFRS